jgi:threonine/homoserine/homoserine lactone efflux protein
VFALLGLAWLTGYALLAVRLATLLRRPTVRAALDAISGVVLVAVGVRLALERW